MQQSMPQPIQLEEVIAAWPPQAQKAAQAIAKVVGADNGEKAVAFLQSATNIVIGAATFVFRQITEAEKRIADIDDELLYGDGGLGDAMLALIFHYAQQAGVEGADNMDAYEASREALDELANFEPGGAQGDGPEAEAPQEAAPPQAGPPMGGGRPLMAGG